MASPQATNKMSRNPIRKTDAGEKKRPEPEADSAALKQYILFDWICGFFRPRCVWSV
jgi:hypothetical protein